MSQEKQFWQSIRNSIPGHKQRIETIGEGTPDVYCCWSGVSYWIELKVYHPDKGGVLLRTRQYGWALEHAAHGGKSFVLIQMPDKTMRLIPAALLKVATYGKQALYVRVLELDKHTIIAGNTHLKDTLQSYLFTQAV